ncbi:hypothetical protein [Mesorhizobium sp. B2-4-6]|uniref:hypothetical protein n=1 Tax=Mesorhizobium sp. B2-4-6 TaxID=2589943 RepID=UPI001128F6D7|nr:hypothetical protein [Mesorhizobium sp. B2-4-6]TPL45340.1 hypothetical protein FJ957_20740 [Mesorhizobium sp. B2-4-6]
MKVLVRAPGGKGDCVVEIEDALLSDRAKRLLGLLEYSLTGRGGSDDLVPCIVRRIRAVTFSQALDLLGHPRDLGETVASSLAASAEAGGIVVCEDDFPAFYPSQNIAARINAIAALDGIGVRPERWAQPRSIAWLGEDIGFDTPDGQREQAERWKHLIHSAAREIAMKAARAA